MNSDAAIRIRCFNRRSMRRFLVELLLVCAGCDVTGSVGEGFDPHTQQLMNQSLRLDRHSNVDILFVVDNSSGMGEKQIALRAALPSLQQELVGNRHYHFGVITTDLGAGPKGFGNCSAPGDGALLISRGGFFNPGCLGPIGGRFIDQDLAVGPLQKGDNLPPGQGWMETLDCMLDVGDTGCGFEQPLEAARRALSGEPVNAGFLRDDSLLIIVLLTDRDDCSAPLESSVFADPTDAFACTRAGVVCGFPGQPPSSNPDFPPLDCTASVGGALFDLSRYRDFFFSVGGVKRDPNDVRIISLSAPATPLEVVSDPLGRDALGPVCGTPDGVGFPAVRMHTLFDGQPTATEASICTSGSYEYALGTIASTVRNDDGWLPCLPLPLANPGHADCTVQIGPDTLPECPTSPNRCWQLVERTDCVPVWNPRTRQNEQWALDVTGFDPPTFASCTVIAPK
jgi:hypothetical protein